MSEIPEKKLWLEKVTPVNDASPFDREITAFLNDALIAGHRPYELSPSWSFGLGQPENRTIEFVYRGHGHRAMRGRYLFEVLPIEGGQILQLGPLFGIREYACIVVSGIQGIRAVSSAWLAGEDLQQVLHSTQFYDRMNLSEPLAPTSKTAS